MAPASHPEKRGQKGMIKEELDSLAIVVERRDFLFSQGNIQ
jgi:hypothetical protein